MILPVVLYLLKAVQIDYLEQRKPEFFEQHHLVRYLPLLFVFSVNVSISYIIVAAIIAVIRAELMTFNL